MGPITALGTESWLINSNSLTNCFFTKNHLSLSHGTHMHEKLHFHAQPTRGRGKKKKKKEKEKLAQTHNRVHTAAGTHANTQSNILSTHELSCPHKRTRTHLLSCIYRKGNMLITLEWLIIAQ